MNEPNVAYVIDKYAKSYTYITQDVDEHGYDDDEISKTIKGVVSKLSLVDGVNQNVANITTRESLEVGGVIDLNGIKMRITKKVNEYTYDLKEVR